MPKKDVIEVSFQKRGIFSVDDLFAVPAKYLKSEGFKVIEEETIDKGDERKTVWSAKWKITYYVKLIITVTSSAWDIKKVDAKGKGKLQSASTRVKIKGEIETDYEKDWDGNKFKEYMRKIKEELFIKSEIKAKKQIIRDICKNLKKELKAASESIDH